jgi:hypothetical protein
MTTGLTEDDRQRIREFVERAPRNCRPDVSCPEDESESESNAEDARE